MPVARVVQLATHLEQKRLTEIAYETRRFVRIGESDVVINQRIADKSQPILKIYYYHCNHLGTPQELSDEKGDIIWLSYDRAWGGSFDTLYKPQFIDNFAISENELQPFKFQGQSLDVETGLHYNRFRYYDSDVGMFISRDPIELLGGINNFAYAPNPIEWIDPYGLATSIWQKNWEAKYGTLPSNYQVHHIIPKAQDIEKLAKNLCSSFDVHSVDNLIALPTSSNVTLINKPGFGKALHLGYHKGYSMAVKKLLQGAARFNKPGLTGCVKLKALQSSLKSSLQSGNLSLYKGNSTDDIMSVMKPWISETKTNLRK